MKTNNAWKNLVLENTTEGEALAWLEYNPVPQDWSGDEWSWVHSEMKCGRFLTWLRRNILRWNF
jgi:hypothetical protein